MSLSNKNMEKLGVSLKICPLLWPCDSKATRFEPQPGVSFATWTKREGFFYLIGGDDGKSLAPWINVGCRWVVGRIGWGRAQWVQEIILWFWIIWALPGYSAIISFWAKSLIRFTKKKCFWCCLRGSWAHHQLTLYVSSPPRSSCLFRWASGATT